LIESPDRNVLNTYDFFAAESILSSISEAKSGWCTSQHPEKARLKMAGHADRWGGMLDVTEEIAIGEFIDRTISRYTPLSL
jgi:hypothetical protein